MRSRSDRAGLLVFLRAAFVPPRSRLRGEDAIVAHASRKLRETPLLLFRGSQRVGGDEKGKPFERGAGGFLQFIFK